MRWATTSRSGAHTTKRRDRIVQHLEAGSATAVPSNIKYRLGKLLDFGLLRGEWLDCGCADGGYTVALVDLGAESAVGIDTQEEQIVQARERERTHPTVRFLCASAESLPFPEAAFDNVYLCCPGYLTELHSDSCEPETTGRANCGTWSAMKASSFARQALFGRCSKSIPGFHLP